MGSWFVVGLSGEMVCRDEESKRTRLHVTRERRGAGVTMHADKA